MSHSLVVLALALLFPHGLHSQQPSERAAISSLMRDAPSLMAQAGIPGLSIALIDRNHPTWVHSFGEVDPATHQPVTDHTLFSAASLSKPLFTYAVLQLVDQGKLDLDTPLTRYWPERVVSPANDPRLDKITARLVLSHRSGLPNWRPEEEPLQIAFTPGERFSYSGEGFLYLQHTVEHIEGRPLNEIMRQLVFLPLGMNDSTYISLPGPGISPGYSPGGQPRPPLPSKGGNAAFSLLTNAHDYSLFLEAILSGRNLKPATLHQMETPQVAIDPACINCTGHAPGRLSSDLFWGLSWGIEQTPSGKYLWHWGDNPSYKAFVVIDLARSRALVLFTNSQDGLAIAPALVKDAIGGDHPAFRWLHYDTYDSPNLRFTLDVAHEGAKALAEHSAELQSRALAEETLESAGYLLLYEQKKYDDAIAVFQRNAGLYPSSANANASLGEAYMVAGKKEPALACYERTLELMPTSDKARSIIARLRSEIANEKAAHQSQ